MTRFLLPIVLMVPFAGCAARRPPVAPNQSTRADVVAAVARTQEELARSGYGRTTGANREAFAYAAIVREAHPQAYVLADQTVPRLEEFGETTVAAAQAEHQRATQELELVRTRIRGVVNPISFPLNSSVLNRESMERINVNADYIDRNRGAGGVVAVAGFAEPSEQRAALLAQARAYAVISELQGRVIPSSMVRGGGVGTDRGYGGANNRALIMYFARDNVTRTISGPRLRGPLGAVRSRVEAWARHHRWVSSDSVEPIELKFPQVPERRDGRRRRWASYRVIFMPDSRQPGCLETYILFNFYSQSVRERRTYSTTADRNLLPSQSPTAQALLQALETIGPCNG